MSLRVEPDAGFAAGHAVIVVDGAAGAAGQAGFRVQRDAGWGDDKLGPGGWQSSDALLQPDRAEAVGGNLVLHVGWGVCRHLEAGIYEVSVPGAGQEAVGVYWPEIVPLYEGSVPVSGSVQSSAMSGQEGGGSLLEVAHDPQETVVLRPEPVVVKPQLTPPPVVAAPVVTPSAVLPPYEEPKSGILIVAGIVGLLILLLVVGGGAFWWMHRTTEVAVADPVPMPRPGPGPGPVPGPSPTPSPVQVQPPVPTPVAPEPMPVGLAGLSVPDVLVKAPNVGAITVEGLRRLQGTQKDDGMLLLEAAADRGDPGAAAALGKLYDPVLFQPGGPIPKADARQAARYYRDAARGGVDVTAAREALRQRLLAQSGDLSATLILKDFWP